MNIGQTILSTKALAVGYTNTQPLIKQLDVSVRQGELICLLGTNGSGKSTLLRTLSGMQKALSGEVFLLNQLIQELHAKAKARQLSLVLTERGIAPNLSAYELIAMGRHPYTSWFGGLGKKDLEVIEQAMEATGTQNFANRAFFRLSDGERQKVLIARALAQDTPLIILDEPTVHLDLPNRVEIMQLLHSLAHQQQKAILMSSHDLELVLQTADQLWLLHQQKIVSGIPEDLVLQGQLKNSFQSKNLRFDRQRGSFVLRRHTQHLINLQGEGEVAHWTQQALERVGYKVVHDSSIRLSVSIQKTSPVPTWVLQVANEAVMCRSLSALVHSLLQKHGSVTSTLSEKE
ncbi:ABC transporter ATP-binding protein [Porifericola rhodea]|uniref:ABC transporter ATP-binding protein n=1 Tax=Porifericola rhodea TaxID=930972 RepID=UPI002665E3A0|nr:ABC transporter ATP-binding protein [Porifericola rhodea]WKN29901.1 ABC transporter ATP-binding protein [Porifericola rhodea]